MNEEKREAHNALLSVTGKRQFTLLTDGGHGSLENEKLFADPGFVEGLSKQGVRHIFLEIDEEKQPAVNDFYAGKISARDLSDKIGTATALDADERVQQKNLEIQFFENAKKNNIQIHFVDPKPEVETTYPDRAHVSRLIGEGITNGTVTSDAQAEEVAKRYNLTLKDMHEYQDMFSKERDNADFKIADAVKEASGNEKALIVYGSLHLTQDDNDLPALLGKDKCVVIEMKTPDSVGNIAPDYVFKPLENDFDRTLRGAWRGAPAPDHDAQILPPAPAPAIKAETPALKQGNFAPA